MFRFRKLLVLLFLVPLFIIGCNPASDSASIGNGSTMLSIKTSNYPFLYLTDRITGEKANVEGMIQLGVDPHSWEPTPVDLLKLEKTHILFYSGLGMEEWVEDIAAAINNRDLAILSVTQHVPSLPEVGEDHQIHGNGHEEVDHGHFDPHVWLDPINCITIATNIKNLVIEKDPANKDYYEKNYNELVEDLNKLDAAYKKELSNISRRQFVVNHAAFGYLAQRYGLIQIPIMGINPHTEPTSKKMIEITDLLRNYNLNCIFTETIINSKAAQVLAEEAGIQTKILNPLGNLTKEDIKAGKDFLSIMYENLEALKSAMQ